MRVLNNLGHAGFSPRIFITFSLHSMLALILKCSLGNLWGKKYLAASAKSYASLPSEEFLHLKAVGPEQGTIPAQGWGQDGERGGDRGDQHRQEVTGGGEGPLFNDSVLPTSPSVCPLTHSFIVFLASSKACWKSTLANSAPYIFWIEVKNSYLKKKKGCVINNSNYIQKWFSKILKSNRNCPERHEFHCNRNILILIF